MEGELYEALREYRRLLNIRDNINSPIQKQITQIRNKIAILLNKE